jgi:hypothetical protein
LLLDLDGEGGLDAVFTGGMIDSPVLEQRPRVDVWLGSANANNFEHRGQCALRIFGIVTGTGAADFDGDGDQDIAYLTAVQTSESGPRTYHFGVLSNGPIGTNEQCCPAENVARTTQLLPPEPRGPVAATATGIKLETLRRLRDEVMILRDDGNRLAGLYQELTPDILDAMMGTSLLLGMNGLLHSWQPNIDALVAGEGSTVFITAEQALSADSLLLGFSTEGSPERAQAIAVERARLPPFAQFVGMDMDGFADLVLGPTLVLFEDGFEAAE